MGKKVNPIALRLGGVRTWNAIWFAQKTFKAFLQEDVRMRVFLKKALKEALVDHIDIERARQNITVTIHTAKPGVVIGRAGAGIEDLTKKLKAEFFRGRRVNLSLNVKEVMHPSLSAQVIGQQIAADIEKRMPFRRVMKMSMERVMKSGALGVKVTLSGRLNGAEIARTETLAIGKIPLHNLRADIDFAPVTAYTIYGTIGIKVWIYRGEVFEKKEEKAAS